MKVLRTWKLCSDDKINNTYVAVKSAAQKLYPQYFTDCEYYFFINSSKKCLGKCVYDYRKETLKNKESARCKTIVILLSRFVPVGDVLRVLIHEFAHAVSPLDNHSGEWKIKAESIGAVFGEKGFNTRCKNDEQARFNDSTGKTQNFKYAVVCQKCGRVAKREKLCKLITHPEKYRCAYCGGKFKRAF